MIKFVCDSCGKEVEYTEYGDDGQVPHPPGGWRRIYTQIDEFDSKGAFPENTSECCHSCDDCNSQMSVDEHLEAEHDSRKGSMDQKAKEYIGFFHPQSKRFCYTDEKEAHPKRHYGYILPVFVRR